MAAASEAAEDLMEMGLGAAGLRVFSVLPVDDLDVHGGEKVVEVVEVVEAIEGDFASIT